MRPGDIVLTSKGGGFFPKLIVIGQTIWGKEISDVYHAMRYLGKDSKGIPLFMSQELTAKIKPISAWKGKTLRFWSNPTYTQGERKKLIEASKLVQGRRYDWLGIIGQACRAIPIIGKWLTPWIETPWTTYCSELVCQTEQKVYPEFYEGKSQPSPQDIDDWCRAHDWECKTIQIN